MPYLQQGLLKTFKSQNPQPFSHRRETFQVPTQRLREGFQCAKQYEEARARLPHRRR
jgi:hypothetical protein